MSRDACSQFMELLERVVWTAGVAVGCIAWTIMSASPLLAADPPDKLLDCTVTEVLQPDLTLARKAANFSFATGPDLSDLEEERVTWNRISQGLLTRYVELCQRYNLGNADRGEYRDRLRDLEGYYRVAKDFEERLLEKADPRMRESLGGTGDSGTRSLESYAQRTQKSLLDPLQAFAQEIGELGPTGRLLQPKRPAESPDILGAPAMK